MKRIDPQEFERLSRRLRESEKRFGDALRQIKAADEEKAAAEKEMEAAHKEWWEYVKECAH